MLLLSAITLPSVRLVLLGVAAGMLYLVGRFVLGSIPARIDRPALRAMLAAIAVVVVAVVAVFVNRPLVALHLPIAAATAAMTFGVAALITGRNVSADESFSPNRSWGLLAPAVAMLMIIGFGGRMDGWVMAAIAGYGALALWAWRGDAMLPVVQPAEEMPPTPASHSSLSAMAGLWLVAVGVAGLAGYLAMLGLPGLEARPGMPADAIVVAFLLAPAIVVPLFFELLPPCRPIGWGASFSTLAIFALLCICFALPIVAMVQADAEVLRSWARLTSSSPDPSTMAATMPSSTTPATTPASAPAHLSPTVMLISPTPKIVFPMLPAIALRVDVLVLAAATLLTIPFAAGWLRPTRFEALILMACYVFGLLLLMKTVLA